ncbi:OLC1v1013005C1 [Oldenlandia corymbosa var. corymbosa]|uniref:OLC1v1013005C1 n=1 Tax=Oldenlandia corymbosa var. corymbosa TaxID=529605 RepID=A0AAV1E0I5_OLDCO|nr:OLC1v1013005C1 [Oldenlandia corymbosa var. corymbosa]
MEAIVSQIELSNKENRVPYKTQCCSNNNFLSVGIGKAKFSNPIVGRRRWPLQDITQLFINVQSRQPPFRFNADGFCSGFQVQNSVLSVGHCRKRKRDAVNYYGIDSTRKDAGKILRHGFR